MSGWPGFRTEEAFCQETDAKVPSIPGFRTEEAFCQERNGRKAAFSSLICFSLFDILLFFYYCGGYLVCARPSFSAGMLVLLLCVLPLNCSFLTLRMYVLRMMFSTSRTHPGMILVIPTAVAMESNKFRHTKNRKSYMHTRVCEF